MAKTDLYQNEFRSTLAGVTVEGRAHPLSAWFVLALRLVIGFAFLYSGAKKVIGGFDRDVCRGRPVMYSVSTHLWLWSRGTA